MQVWSNGVPPNSLNAQAPTETAVIVAVPAAEPLGADTAAARWRGCLGMPTHVTVLGPLVAKGVNQDVITTLAAVVRVGSLYSIAVLYGRSPDGIRTRATALRGRRARPLHNGALAGPTGIGCTDRATEAYQSVDPSSESEPPPLGY